MVLRSSTSRSTFVAGAWMPSRLQDSEGVLVANVVVAAAELCNALHYLTLHPYATLDFGEATGARPRRQAGSSTAVPSPMSASLRSNFREEPFQIGHRRVHDRDKVSDGQVPHG